MDITRGGRAANTDTCSRHIRHFLWRYRDLFLVYISFHVYGHRPGHFGKHENAEPRRARKHGHVHRGLVIIRLHVYTTDLLDGIKY